MSGEGLVVPCHRSKCMFCKEGVVYDTDMNRSCTAFGGVWRADVGRFANRAWVMSQQLHYLLERTRCGAYYYPEPVERSAK